MKYGDTLRQRSIAEWGHYNIDYDYLKDLIKHHTTPGAGKAVSIPGQGETTEKVFGDTFFQVLQAQHDRINLFIRSKSGEIERRLDYINKSLAQLQARGPTGGPGLRLPAKTVEKYAKIDADIHRAGEEIRSLSRFRVAQRTGFLKILKKYRRWTKDSELERQFKKEVAGSPESFFQIDLSYLLDQYIDVLGALRAPLDDFDASTVLAKNTTSRLAKVIEQGSEIDFDIALSTIPLGSQGARATYWIHPDQIVEVEVLLLQHMHLSTCSNQNPTPRDSPYATPARRKSSATADRYLGNEDEIGLIILDDPESFARKQNATTIGSIEEATGIRRAKAAAHARWTSSGTAAVVVGLESNKSLQEPEDLQVEKLKVKQLSSILDSQAQTSIEGNTAPVQKWLADNEHVKPLASICSRRTRFAGLQNNSDGGIWASLDRDIGMKAFKLEDLKSDEWTSEARAGASSFPHAVLEVRREGNHSTSLIQALDRSHLVERVRGFSLETQAVWTCCKPFAMSKPLWISLLDTDIRKLPAPVRRQRRRAANTADPYSHASPPRSSASATSMTDGRSSGIGSRNEETSATSAPEFVEPPPLRAFRKKSRKPHSHYPSPIREVVQPQQRYWNEYDNPESEDDGYYIYIDPNATLTYPGQEFFEGCVGKLMQLIGRGKSKETSPLLSPTDDETSDDETVDESVIGGLKTYGTMTTRRPKSGGGMFSGLFRSLRGLEDDDALRRMRTRERFDLLSEIQVRQHEREMTKLRLYSTCLAAAVVIDLLLGALVTTSRRKERGEVDTVVIFGTICNLCLLGVAVSSMATRRERLSSIHQGLVYLVVIASIVVDALLLRWVLSL